METKTRPTYITVSKPHHSWDELPQEYLGDIEWAEAVKIAKARAKESNTEVRLSNYLGYNASGHYFRL